MTLESLTGVCPVVISVDSYYRPWQDIDSRGAPYVDWESLDSLNLELLNAQLLELLEGKEVLVPEYDMKTSTPMSQDHWIKTRVPPGALIIMEGIHCLNPALTARVPRSEKFLIMISPLCGLVLDENTVLSNTTVRIIRRMVRDYLYRGRSAVSTLKQWPGVARGEQSNIYPNQKHADAVMNSSLVYELNVLKVYAEPLLRSVPYGTPEYEEAKRLLGVLQYVYPMSTDLVPPQSLLREFVSGSWYYEHRGMCKNG